MSTAQIDVKLVDCSMDIITAPSILPNVAGTDYYELLEPSLTYSIPTQFTNGNAFCPLNSLTIEAISTGSTLDFAGTDGITFAAVNSLITDSQIDVLLPSIQEPFRYFTFRIKGFSPFAFQYTADVKVKLKNCNYVLPTIKTSAVAYSI